MNIPAFLALDPGTDQTAWVCMANGIPRSFALEPNAAVLARLEALGGPVPLAIEMIASYGMPVGAEVFETCVWIGRFTQASRGPVTRILRREVKDHLCHSPRANDATVRQALIDRYGPGKEAAIGTKHRTGPLYGIKADIWAALAVGVVMHDRLAHAGSLTPTSTPVRN
jgi:hypothetical protein